MIDAPQKPSGLPGCLIAMACPAIGFVTGYMCGMLAGPGDFGFATGALYGMVGAGIGLVVGLVGMVAFWK